MLKLGAASAAVLALAGGAAALLGPGIIDARLSPDGRQIFAAAGAALLDGCLPTAQPQRAQALAAFLDRTDTLIAGLPLHAQSELSLLVATLATAPGRLAIARLTPAWRDASVAQVQESLQSMRVSGVSLREQAYQALHDITSGAFFSSQDTWALLGYPGPVKV